MTNKDIKHLGSLNPQDFFCSCGQGENGKCPAFHAEGVRTAGSDVRTMALLASLGIMCIAVLLYGLLMAAKI